MQNANNIEQVIEFNRLRVEESEDAVLAAEMKTLSLCSLLQLLEKLLQKHPTIAIQECVQRFPNIRPWNVRRTVKASGEKYVQYISNLLTSRNDIITIEYAVHALLHIDISKMHHHCTTWPSIALQQTTTSITPNSEIWSKLSIPLLIDVQSSLLIVYILESIHADDIYQKALVDHLAVLQKFPKQHLVQFIQKTISKLSIKWLQLTIQTLNDHIDTISTSTIAEIFTLLQSHLHPPQVLQICTACPSFTASISFPAFQKLFSIEQVEKRYFTFLISILPSRNVEKSNYAEPWSKKSTPVYGHHHQPMSFHLRSFSFWTTKNEAKTLHQNIFSPQQTKAII